jgi:hypothetical protein
MRGLLALLFGTTHRMTFISPSVGSIKWNDRDPESIARAEKAFNESLKAGGMIMKENEDGSPGEKLVEFDPKTDQVVVKPITAG